MASNLQESATPSWPWPKASASPSAICGEDRSRRITPTSPSISGALSRHPRPAPRRKRPGKVRRLLPLRGGLPRALHLYRSRRKHRSPANLRRRALRLRLQHRLLALHLLRLLRRGLPHRRHHPRPRLRASHLRHQLPDLPQGSAPRSGSSQAFRRKAAALSAPSLYSEPLGAGVYTSRIAFPAPPCRLAPLLAACPRHFATSAKRLTFE